MSARSFTKDVLGPGLLFAGAAVGVSHLVQSTRAGAMFGLGLLWVVVLANLSKYPGFIFASHYTAASGESILHGYRRQGKWALLLYILITIATMFIVQGAVTATCAGLVSAGLGLSIKPLLAQAAVLAACVLVLAGGGFRLLEVLMKFVVGLFTITTITATIVVLTQIDWTRTPMMSLPSEWDGPAILFVVALAGWMPAPLDLAVWNSLWSLEKNKTSGHRANISEALLDFRVGYLGAAGLAICFVILGTWVLGKDISASGAAGFAASVIDIYGDTLGLWAEYVVGTAAVMVMFSTTITVLDGFPRALSSALAVAAGHDSQSETKSTYWLWLAVVAVGSLTLLEVVVPKTGFTPFIDVATGVAVLTAPLFALLNHRASFSDHLQPDAHPAKYLQWLSYCCMAMLMLLAGLWLWARFWGPWNFLVSPASNNM